jgi:hypothetical protein
MACIGKELVLTGFIAGPGGKAPPIRPTPKRLSGDFARQRRQHGERQRYGSVTEIYASLGCYLN